MLCSWQLWHTVFDFPLGLWPRFLQFFDFILQTQHIAVESLLLKGKANFCLKWIFSCLCPSFHLASFSCCPLFIEQIRFPVPLAWDSLLSQRLHEMFFPAIRFWSLKMAMPDIRSVIVSTKYLCSITESVSLLAEQNIPKDFIYLQLALLSCSQLYKYWKEQWGYRYFSSLSLSCRPSSELRLHPDRPL